MKKVLFISYFSPPFDDLESRMVKNLASRLPESGWNTVVVSSKYAFNCPKSSEPAERTGLRVVSSGVKKEGFLLRALYSLRFVPDPQIGWFWFSRRAAECELKNGTDVIISRSNPITSHLVALALKKKNPGIPWVAIFGDPWTQNPYIKFRFGFTRRFFERLERKIFSFANAVVVTNEETKNLFLSRYKDADIRVIPNSWSDSDKALADSLLKKSGEKNESMTLVHAGSFYGLRSPEPFFRALQMVMKERPDAKIRAVFCGGLGKFSGLLGEYSLGDSVKILGVLPRPEAFRELARADVLLLIDAPVNGSMFLPVKFAEYLLFGKPILAITPPGATASAVLKTQSGIIVSPEDSEMVKDEILGLYAEWEKGTLKVSAGEKEIRSFGAEECSRRLADILEEISKKQ